MDYLDSEGVLTIVKTHIKYIHNSNAHTPLKVIRANTEISQFE